MPMDPEKRFLFHCRANGYPVTRQRLDLVRHIFQRNEPFTAENLLNIAADQGIAVSRATLFRVLEILQQAGMISSQGTHFLIAGQ